MERPEVNSPVHIDAGVLQTPCPVSQRIIDKYAILHKREFGEELTQAEAKQKANDLVKLVSTILQINYERRSKNDNIK